MGSGLDRLKMPLELPDPQARPEGLSVIVVGNDTLIDALPAHPIQLAHACRAAGIDLVIPLSWGDELIAGAVVRQLQSNPGRPAVLCACPVVRQRLLAHGTELEPLAVTSPPPPAALAHYLRQALGPQIGSLAFVGRCPGARDAGYDVLWSPPEFLGALRGSVGDLSGFPELYDSVLAPDRRRHLSLPGGCPTDDVLWRQCNERELVTVEADDLGVALAQQLLAHNSTLIDLAPALGCACSGVTPSTPGRSARIAVMSLEPPRSPSPVVSDPGMPGPRGPGPSEGPPTDAGPDGRSTALPDQVAAATDPDGTSASGWRRPPLATTPPGALAVPNRRGEQAGRERSPSRSAGRLVT